jgi:hypothetical protein
MTFILILIGPMIFSYYPEASHRPYQETRTFVFINKDDCEKAADSMYMAREVFFATCVEVDRRG